MAFNAWKRFIKYDPIFDELRNEPEFKDLIDRMNFPD
jgi:hypothetical protein